MGGICCLYGVELINMSWGVSPVLLLQLRVPYTWKISHAEILPMHVTWRKLNFSPSEKYATFGRVIHAIGKIKVGEIFTQYKVRAIGEFFDRQKFRICGSYISYNGCKNNDNYEIAHAVL